MSGAVDLGEIRAAVRAVFAEMEADIMREFNAGKEGGNGRTD